MPAAGPHHSGGARLPRLPAAGRPAGFCYLGPVFRYRGHHASEFLQAGVESFGRTDTRRGRRRDAGAGARGAARRSTSPMSMIRTGDVGAVRRPDRCARARAVMAERRLLKDFNRKSLAGAGPGTADALHRHRAQGYEGVLAALAGSDRKAAHALVTDLMSIAGRDQCRRPVGGRNRRSLPRTVDPDRRHACRRDIASSDRTFPRPSPASPTKRWRELRALASDAKLDLTAALDQFESRIGFMAARGIDIGSDAVRHLVRPRHRLLHRLRVRTAPQGQRRRAAGRRRAATTG